MEIAYDFRFRDETGTERPLLYIIYKCTVEYSRQLIEVVVVLFLTFSALVAKPKKLLYTVANPARGLLNRGKKKGFQW